MKHRTVFFLALLALLAVGVATLLYGETPILELGQQLIDRWQGRSTSWNALFDERLPRLIVLLATGSSLALCGVAVQAFYRNGLASPEILGLNAGGNLLMLGVFLMQWHHIFPFLIPLSGVVGALLSMLLVYGFGRVTGCFDQRSLLFVGIALSTVLTAVGATLTYVLRHEWSLMQTLMEWHAGCTMDRTWSHVHMQAPLALIGIGGLFTYRRELNLLTLGEEEAINLGVDLKQVRWRLFLFISLLVGGALAGIGMVPFFGLVLPHIVRRLVGPNHEILLPACGVIGGIALAAIDLGLRVLDVRDLSIGNVCSIIGGLFFLYLLYSEHRAQGRGYAGA
jgi:iron complex transport system permease protein